MNVCRSSCQVFRFRRPVQTTARGILSERSISLFVVTCLWPILTGTTTLAQNGATMVRKPIEPKINIGEVAIDRYVATPDSHYKWELVSQKTQDGISSYVVDLTSQKWLTEEEVDRPIWKHWLTIAKPVRATSNKALLFIGGGRNGREAPSDVEARLKQVALATNSVVAELGQIPNQPLVFHNDGVPRVEDDLIGYTWDQYLKTGDERWPARLPMVKSVVRAMDTVEALMASDLGGNMKVDQFVVAGGSKRGWTTWMTAAVDNRVCAIVPIVIDVLNVDVSMRHHYSAYGFWAPAIGDYVNHKVMHRANSGRYQNLMQLADPYAYRDRFTMPKCIVNATGDQFFLPDSSQFYFDQLPGEKHLCYVPNGEHSLDGTNALDTLVAFHFCIVHNVQRPEFKWTYDSPNTIQVACADLKPERAILWSADNPQTRDFRVDTIGRAYQPTELKANGDGRYEASVSTPDEGWRAYFVQLEYNVGAPRPLRLSTPVKVIPEELPFSDKQPPLIEE